MPAFAMFRAVLIGFWRIWFVKDMNVLFAYCHSFRAFYSLAWYKCCFYFILILIFCWSMISVFFEKFSAYFNVHYSWKKSNEKKLTKIKWMKSWQDESIYIDLYLCAIFLDFSQICSAFYYFATCFFLLYKYFAEK